MKYERLTNNVYNTEYDLCYHCKYYGEPNGCNREDGECVNYDRFMDIYDRLVELEDKIENGTLVQLPCKVGDMVYAKDKWLNRMFYGRLTNIELDCFGFTYLVYDNENHQYYQCREVFLTKAEAENKLAELKGEKNE